MPEADPTWCNRTEWTGTSDQLLSASDYSNSMLSHAPLYYTKHRSPLNGHIQVAGTTSRAIHSQITHAPTPTRVEVVAYYTSRDNCDDHVNSIHVLFDNPRGHPEIQMLSLVCTRYLHRPQWSRLQNTHRSTHNEADDPTPPWMPLCRIASGMHRVD